jgi:hypothetical protein
VQAEGIAINQSLWDKRQIEISSLATFAAATVAFIVGIVSQV